MQRVLMHKSLHLVISKLCPMQRKGKEQEEAGKCGTYIKIGQCVPSPWLFPRVVMGLERPCSLKQEGLVFTRKKGGIFTLC